MLRVLTPGRCKALPPRQGRRGVGNVHSLELGTFRAGITASFERSYVVQASSEGGCHQDNAPNPERKAKRKLSEAHRAKIAAALRRKWKDPEFREKVATSNSGQEPWNKGRQMSDDMRSKLAESRRGRKHSKATRTKISKRHSGRQLGDNVRAQISERFSGVPKSDEHRARIAAAQRKRHAASRVLTAIERYYAEQPVPVRIAAPASSRRNNVRVYAAGKAGTSTFKKEVVDEYMSMLREYRALQDELTPWTTAFMEQNDRKPRLGDVERTGIDWLIAKYKQYSLLRERILSDTLSLRSRVSSASEDPNAIYERARRASSSSKPAGGGRSINYVPGVSSPAAGREGLARVAAARGYLNGRGGGKVAPTGKKNTLDIISSQDDIDDAAWGQSGQGLGLPAVKGDISAPTTSLRPPSATPGRLAPPLTSAAASDADAVGGTAKEEEPEMEGKMASVAMDVSANPKLRAALGKALEYRRAKAHTTAQGAAIAAASAARSRPVASQGSNLTVSGFPNFEAQGSLKGVSKNATVSFEAGAAVKSARFGSGDTAGGSSPQERSRGGDGGAEAGTEQGERASTSEGGSSEGTRAAERTYGEMEGTDEAGGVPWSELCSTGSGMEVQKGLDATREKPSGGKEEEEDRAALVKP